MTDATVCAALWMSQEITQPTYDLRFLTFDRATHIQGRESTLTGFTQDGLRLHLANLLLHKNQQGAVIAYTGADIASLTPDDNYAVVAETYNPDTGELVRFLVKAGGAAA